MYINSLKTCAVYLTFVYYYARSVSLFNTVFGFPLSQTIFLLNVVEFMEFSFEFAVDEMCGDNAFVIEQ